MLIEFEVKKTCDAGMRSLEIADADIEQMTATGASEFIKRQVAQAILLELDFVVHSIKHCESVVTSAV